jgi:hypothetical protein
MVGGFDRTKPDLRLSFVFFFIGIDQPEPRDIPFRKDFPFGDRSVSPSCRGRDEGLDCGGRKERAEECTEGFRLDSEFVLISEGSRMAQRANRPASGLAFARPPGPWRQGANLEGLAIDVRKPVNHTLADRLFKGKMRNNASKCEFRLTIW